MSIRILQVEDDILCCRMYRALLAEEGYSLDYALNVTGGLSMIEESMILGNPYLLIILDLKLGSESGLDLLKEVKGKWPHLPVIINTAYSIYRDMALEWGADAVCIKALDLSEFKGAIKKLVNAT